MGWNVVAAKLLQPTEVSKMRPEGSLHISIMRTKCSIIFVHTHTHTHPTGRGEDTKIVVQILVPSAAIYYRIQYSYEREKKKAHYVQATNVHTHDNHIPQCQHNPADVQYTHCQVHPFTLTKVITHKHT